MGLQLPGNLSSPPGGVKSPCMQGNNPTAEGERMAFPTRSTLAPSLVGNMRTKESHRHLLIPRWKRWSWQHSRRGRRILNIFTLYLTTSSATSYTSLDDSPTEALGGGQTVTAVPASSCSHSRATQLSTCTDHSTQTFPNAWAQPAPPGKAGNQLWSGRNSHPAYSS